MAQALIRNLDDGLIEDYREAAKANGRSLEAELRLALERMRPKSPMKRAELIKWSRRLRAMTPPVAQTPSEDLIREDREGRRDA
jgi:antitoxin FitA